MLVVIEVIIDGVCSVICCNKSYVISDMHLFGEILYIKSDIHNLSVFFVRSVVSYQIGTCEFVDSASIQFKHLLDFSVSKELSVFVDNLLIFLSLFINVSRFNQFSFQEVFSQEWVMNL